MQYATLGKSSLNISRIAFGCMALKPDQPNIQWLTDEAIDQGVNFFDTSNLYDKGLNETNLGMAFGAKRNQVIIATKVGNQWRSDGSGWDWNPGKEYVLQAVEQSLLRLHTDYIDLYQLHGGTINDPIDETIEAFELLQQQGKIRFYGISSIRPNVIREYVRRSNMVSVMMQYSLLDRRPEETCFDLLKENEIGVLARGTIASGLLVNKPPKDYLGYNAEEVAEAAAAIKNLAGKSPAAQPAINFALHHKAVVAAVVGMHTAEQLKIAVKAPDQPLSEIAWAALGASVKANTYQEHR